jgi:hypothetical protein
MMIALFRSSSTILTSNMAAVSSTEIEAALAPPDIGPSNERQ